MKSKAFRLMLICILILSSFNNFFLVENCGATGNTIYVDDDGGADYTQIQDAIDSASAGDIVFVYNGTYYGNVQIHNSIDLIGENRETTIIDGDFNGHVITLYSSESVNISGFTIKNSGLYDAGIYGSPKNIFITDNIIFDNNRGLYIYTHPNVDSVQNVIVSNNIIRDNDWDGVTLGNIQNLLISNNTINDNGCLGISLGDVQNASITSNIIKDNDECGIYFEFMNPSFFNEITIINNNTISDSSQGIRACAWYGNETIITNNTIFNISEYGIIYEYANSSSLGIISYNNISNCGDCGILLWSTAGADVFHNNISNCESGISIYRSENCMVSYNNISSEINYYNIGLWGACKNIDILYNSLNGAITYIKLDDIAGVGASEISIIGHTLGYIRAKYTNKLTISNNNVNQINFRGSINESIISNNILSATYSSAIYFQDGSLSHHNVVYNNTILAGYCTFYGNNHTIAYNTFNNGGKGINISGNGNKFFGNTISNASGTGVYVQGGYHENLIYHNNFLNNTQQACDKSRSNNWDNGYPSGGNYWSDFDEPSEGAWDNDSDGIVDTPYDIPGRNNQDNYPLVNPWDGENQPPEADFSYSPPNPTTLDIVTFTDTSTDPDGTIVNLTWDFGDGNFSYERNPTHIYPASGDYTVTLTVVDELGLNDADVGYVIITKDNEPPSKVTGLTVTDAKDGKLGLSWNEATDNVGVGHYLIHRDGAFLTTVTGVSYQNSGLTNGQSYTYEVSAVDTSGNEGNKSDSVSGTPTASDTGGSVIPSLGPINKAPVADANGPYYELEDSLIAFDGSGSSDSDGEIVSYEWNFGDGNTGTGESPTHAYTDAENYTITLTVTDDSGKTDTDTTYAIISGKPNLPPEDPEVNGSIEGHKDIDYDYTARSTDSDNDTIKYTFDWGDGTNTTTEYVPNGTGYTEMHNWTTAGIYTIKVNAIDEHNASSGTAELIVLIDARYGGDIGYFIDNDGNGIYDSFYSNETGNETLFELQENGEYKIDSDGDGEYDCIYNPVTRAITSLKGDGEETTETSEIPWILIVGIIVAIAIIAIVILLYKKK